jgi:hypothetical protein
VLGLHILQKKLEEAHEKPVAEVLGVSIEQVNQLFIDKHAAESIAAKYLMDSNDIVGLAYDTLFKQLCGERKLRTSEDKQVLAPLAFVSGLAGALLALKLVESHIGYNPYNCWGVRAWSTPNCRMQRSYPTNEKCEFCNSPTYQKVAKDLWA